MNNENIKFTLNGQQVELTVKPGLTLLQLLREYLNLTGTKEGCGKGECGACTVIVEGEAVNSCLFLAAKAAGKNIETIEGVGVPEKMHPIQKAFIEEGAIQCGFCTPGMIMSAKALLEEIKKPTKEEIKEAISGNLCRCTGYVKICNAIYSTTNNQNY